jgi:DNA-binding transcriptional ArsR family regulator
MAKKGNMTDQKQVLDRLIRIDNRTDAIQHNLAWLVRANEPQLKEKLVQAFGNSRRRVQVYLALDGVQTVNGLVKLLGMKQPNVSVEIAWLKKKGLIDVAGADGQGTVYQKTIFDSIINLSDELAAKFSLDRHGRPKKKK